MAFYGADLPANWEESSGIDKQDSTWRRVVSETITEVLFVQLVARGEPDQPAKTRFFTLLPRDSKQLPLVRKLRSRLGDSALADISTASLLAVADTGFQHYLIGILAAVRSEYETALDLFRRTVEVEPDRFLARYYLAMCGERTGRDDLAIRGYRACLDSRPRFAPAYLSLAGVYLRQGKLGLAEEQYRAAAKVTPVARRADVHIGLAHVLMRDNKPEQAVR
jgi:tetratricopeptide (TPR) repeat protein